MFDDTSRHWLVEWLVLVTFQSADRSLSVDRGWLSRRPWIERFHATRDGLGRYREARCIMRQTTNMSFVRSVGWVLGLWLILMSTACTERNKTYCGDGTCVDPARPYCDVDGSFAGVPGTCIAVECTPGTFEACRGDGAIMCSANGNNYDVTQCPLGCDEAASGCRDCTSNAQCDPSAVCDLETSSCRKCKADDECDSRVCDLATGACLLEPKVVYASPSGTGSCSLAQPCSLSNAVVLATNADVPLTLRLLPGTYTTSLQVSRPTATPLQVVATGASIVVIGSVAAVVIDRGSSVEIRGLTTTSEREVQCGTSAALPSALSLTSCSLSSVGSAAAIEVANCTLKLHGVDITINNDPFAILDRGTVEGDQLYIHRNSTTNPAILMAGSTMSLQLTNSVIEGARPALFNTGSGTPDMRLSFVHTTFVLSAATMDVCGGAPVAGVSVRFENRINAEQDGTDVMTGPTYGSCTFANTLLSRQASPPPGTIVGDPAFVDAAMRNFRLTSASPAVDAAPLASINGDHDLEGTARPQGADADLGAYEFHP